MPRRETWICWYTTYEQQIAKPMTTLQNILSAMDALFAITPIGLLVVAALIYKLRAQLAIVERIFKQIWVQILCWNTKRRMVSAMPARLFRAALNGTPAHRAGRAVLRRGDQIMASHASTLTALWEPTAQEILHSKNAGLCLKLALVYCGVCLLRYLVL